MLLNSWFLALLMSDVVVSVTFEFLCAACVSKDNEKLSQKLDVAGKNFMKKVACRFFAVIC
jgi:hypothetical protein